MKVVEGPHPVVTRLSIEVTNRCSKACWFCYAGSGPAGGTSWTADELVAFVEDCAANGLRAVSFGGGEPLEFDGLFEVLARTRGRLFRSVTTNGLRLADPAVVDALVEARPDKVHVSVHFPGDVERGIRQVHDLGRRGLRAGVNLVISQSSADAVARSADRLRASGIGAQRVVYLPMRGGDTPDAERVAEIAGGSPFQSMTCLTGCAASRRTSQAGQSSR